MSTTIKMVAVVDGAEVSVGRCHPGQARLLRKQGIAEWKDGKLLLREPPPETNDDDGVVIDIVGADAGKVADALKVALGPYRPLEFSPPWKKREGSGDVWERPFSEHVRQLAREMFAADAEEIDPAGIVALWEFGKTPGYSWADREHVHGDKNHLREPPAEYTCKSVKEWCEAIAVRKAQGHEMASCDDPKRRMLGFIDYDDNAVFNVGLASLKGGIDEESVAPLGMTVEEFKETVASYVGRAWLIEGEPDEPRTPLTEEELAAIDGVEMWDAPPRHPCNAEIGKPVYDPETGTVSIPVHGIDRKRALRAAADAMSGRSPEKIRSSYPGWKSFSLADDADAVEVVDGDGDVFPDALKMQRPTPEGGVYRRVTRGEDRLLFRIFSAYGRTWLDIATSDGSRYRLDRVIDLPDEWPSLRSAIAAAERVIAEMLEEPSDKS